MIYLGNNELAGVMLGSNEIAGIYVGDDLIYPMTVTAWSVSPSAMTFTNAGGTSQVRIAALSSWTISSSDNWITLSQASGDSGRTTVTVTAGALSGSTPRTATITVTDGTNTSTVSVTQNVCSPLRIADYSGNTNNAGYSYGSNFYIFDTGITEINTCNFDFTGIGCICIRPDAFWSNPPVATLGLWSEGAAATLESFEADCSTVTSLNFPFSSDQNHAPNLTSVTLYNTDNVTTFGNVFYWNNTLVNVSLGNLSNVTDISFGRIFGPDNTSITTVEVDGLPDMDLDVSTWGFYYLTALSVQSLVNIFNALPTTQNGRTITIGQTNINKLTQAQLDIAINKGWNVS